MPCIIVGDPRMMGAGLALLCLVRREGGREGGWEGGGREEGGGGREGEGRAMYRG